MSAQGMYDAEGLRLGLCAACGQAIWLYPDSRGLCTDRRCENERTAAAAESPAGEVSR